VRGICGGFGEVGILFLVWVCARWMGAGARGGECGEGGMLGGLGRLASGFQSKA
jgi:hypothetical protein